jgi:hypothetical protein
MGAGILVASLLGLTALVGLAAMGGGESATYPPQAQLAIAMCRYLARIGQTPPLAQSDIAEQALAIEGIKAVGLGQSWPPGADRPSKAHEFWRSTLELARRIRSGEVTCEVQPTDGGTPPRPQPEPEPELEPEPRPEPDGGPPPSEQLPGVAALTQAMCEHLASIGEYPPLAPLAAAEQALAIKGIAGAGAGGSWPPGRNAAPYLAAYWQGALTLARSVRSGDVACNQPPPTPDVLPSVDAVQRAVCDLLLPYADPESAYLDEGFMPNSAADQIAAAALGRVNYDGQVPPPETASLARRELWSQTRVFALAILAGQQSCEAANRIITINSPKGPGGFVQLVSDPQGRPGNMAELINLYPGMSSATGAERYEAMRGVVEHPYNQQLLVPAEVRYVGQGYLDNVGPMVISFQRRWRSNPRTILERFSSGNAYATPYLPLRQLQ